MTIEVEETPHGRILYLHLHHLVLKHCREKAIDFALHKMAEMGADQVTVIPY